MSVHVGVCGCMWVSVGARGCMWVSVGVCGCIWVYVGVCRCMWVLCGCKWVWGVIIVLVRVQLSLRVAVCTLHHNSISRFLRFWKISSPDTHDGKMAYQVLSLSEGITIGRTYRIICLVHTLYIPSPLAGTENTQPHGITAKSIRHRRRRVFTLVGERT